MTARIRRIGSGCRGGERSGATRAVARSRPILIASRLFRYRCRQPLSCGVVPRRCRPLARGVALCRWLRAGPSAALIRHPCRATSAFRRMRRAGGMIRGRHSPFRLVAPLITALPPVCIPETTSYRVVHRRDEPAPDRDDCLTDGKRVESPPPHSRTAYATEPAPMPIGATPPGARRAPPHGSDRIRALCLALVVLCPALSSLARPSSFSCALPGIRASHKSKVPVIRRCERITRLGGKHAVRRTDPTIH